ncbi:MAG: hypothetical protein ALECFALPRED_000224 [Alectoria fallacina]|uniref:Uncharacterized protein n=1 Tax=Alectoria fallacina TaxID=1903189 RepID=A0A8H3EIV0_9LECA|nr:MAG: hypothetical protein ALECFALPRED_000224 [Alectoria fallacina]
MERDTRQLASSLPPGSSTTRGDQGRHEQAKDGNAWPSGPNQLSGEMVTGRNSFLGVSGKSWKIPRTAGDLGARGVQAGLGDQKWVLDDAGALLASLAGAGVEFPVEADTLEPGAGRAGTAQILGLVDRAHESGPRKATSSVAGLLEHEKDNMVDYGRGDSPVGWRWAEEAGDSIGSDVAAERILQNRKNPLVYTTNLATGLLCQIENYY